MTQSDLDTATLIRRLTENLEASTAERARLWRDIQAARSEEHERRLEYIRQRAEVEQLRASRTALVCAHDELRKALAGFQGELDETKARNERLCAQLAESIAQTERAIKQRDDAMHFSAAARETWAACHRVLGTKPGTIIPHAVADLMKERDEQRARAEKVETELARVRESFSNESAFVREQLDCARSELREARRERDKALSDFATIDRMLVERTKERDNALANAIVIERGRDAAREQLAKLEWAGLRKDDHGGPLSACCPICQGVRPGHEVGSRFALEQVGHQPNCWFTPRQGSIPADAMAAGSQVRISVEFKPEPARPAPRFKVGAPVRVLAGFSNDRRIGTVLASYLTAGGWCYTIKQLSATSICGVPEECLLQDRTVPAFQVGHVVTRAHGPCVVTRVAWCNTSEQWDYYTDNGDGPLAACQLEASSIPAPRFAAGEWVNDGPYAVEISTRRWSDFRPGWVYDVLTVDRAPYSRGEEGLTAQTPQHKHDCKGCACVFLGRYSNRCGGEWDLWYQDAPGRELGFDCGYGLQWFKADFQGGAMTDLSNEARRRARVRGLLSGPAIAMPEPKFAIGEWVVGHGSAAAVYERQYQAGQGWLYLLAGDAGWFGESALTAQTPLHRPDREDSNFLGRFGRIDLWWRPATRELAVVTPAVAEVYGPSDAKSTAASEALRRARIRGLVQ